MIADCLDTSKVSTRIDAGARDSKDKKEQTTCLEGSKYVVINQVVCLPDRYCPSHTLSNWTTGL